MENEKKSSFGRRLIRLALWFAAGLFVFAVLMAATLPLWINPIATRVAGCVVPKLTGTDFRIDRFWINPYSGSLRIGGVKLSNPRDFGDAAAFSVSAFNMDIAVGSLLSDTVVVKDVVIEDAFVSYYSHRGTNNFEVILSNVNGSSEGNRKSADEKKSVASKSDSAGKKVIIDHLRIAGTKVKLMKSELMPPLVMPPLELTDIGRKSGGATLEEAWKQIADGVMKSVTAAGDGLNALGGIIGGGAKDAFGTTAKGAVDATESTINAVNDTAKKAADGMKSLFKGLGK
jgi:hypothetical protein